MSRELLREQCEAYVFGTLEGEERMRLQALIDQGDPECLELLREATELVAMIGYAAPAAEPPALLRSRVLQAIRVEQAPRRWLWLPALGWAAAAGLLVFAVLVRTEGQRLGQELRLLQAQLGALSEEAERNRQVIAVLMARDSRMIRLTTAGAAAPQLRAYWSGTAGLVLAGSNVPAPAAGRTLQLWVVPKSGNPISAGVFQPDQEGRVMLVAASVASPEEAAALAISDEPAGGSPQPTTKPAWVGVLGE